MKVIIIKNQSELDTIKLGFKGEIVITGGSVDDPIRLKEYYHSAGVFLSGDAVVSMYGKSQVKEMWGSSQVKEMRESSQVNSMRENSQVNSMQGSSQVNSMRGSSRVNSMRENSQVNSMRGSSQVNSMWENSQVKEMRENSQVNSMRGSSRVNSMRENSQVNSMWENSQVKEMWGSSLVSKILGQNNKVSCFGFNYVFAQKDIDISGINLNDTSHIILFDSFSTNPSIQFYLKNYPVKENDGILTMFKSVHKTDEGFVSNHDRSFKYEIGETKTHEVSQNQEDSCEVGIHVSCLQWAVDFGKSWDDMAILEIEVPMDSVVVAKDCDGKVRTGTAKVVREVPLEEYRQYL